jgi:hypothetical protein
VRSEFHPFLVCLPCSTPSRVPVLHPFSRASRIPPLLMCFPRPRPPLHIPTHSHAPSASRPLSCPFPCAFHARPFLSAHHAALGFATPAWKKCSCRWKSAKKGQKTPFLRAFRIPHPASRIPHPMCFSCPRPFLHAACGSPVQRARRSVSKLRCA